MLPLLREPQREYILVIALLLAFAVDQWTTHGNVFLVFTSVLATLPTFLQALRALTKKKLTIDTFNIFAVITSFATQEFRSAAFIGLMLSFARYLDWRTESRARHAIEELMRLKPAIARRETKTGVEDIPANEVRKDDVIIVSIGSRVPVDGIVIGGEAHVNESSVTGESKLIRKLIGDHATSSTLVESGGIRMRATAVGKDSTIERMARLIEEASNNKSHTERLADKFASIFLPIVALLGIGTYIVTHDARMMASIFLVACADDMAVAIPLAITAAVGQAARRGVIIKGGEWLNVLGRLNIVVLDKTGTLTYGSLALANTHIHHQITEKTFWSAVGSAEKFSEHPVGRLAYREAQKRLTQIADPLSTKVYEGKGIIAKTKEGSITVGHRKFCEEQKLTLPENLPPHVIAGASTLFHVFIEKQYAGTITVADKPRPEAKKSLAHLQSLGLKRIIMYTGDNKETAGAVSKKLGISDMRAEMSPKDKLRALEELLPEGPVAMVGDGINDAPALARADVGIAMGGGGTAIASEAADVVILSDNLARLPEMITLGRQTTSIIHWDIAIWVVTNLAGFALVFTGFLSPALAAFYNFGTDFLPLLNSARLFRRNEKET